MAVLSWREGAIIELGIEDPSEFSDEKLEQLLEHQRWQLAIEDQVASLYEGAALLRKERFSNYGCTCPVFVVNERSHNPRLDIGDDSACPYCHGEEIV
jgi:hypothetical protein